MSTQTQQKNKDKSLIGQYKGFIAGSIGGIAQVLSGQPFDIIKVRQQNQQKGMKQNALSIGKDLIQKDGIFGLYKGTLTPLFMISLQCSVQFGIFEKAKNYFKKKEQTENIKLKSLLICSFLAGFGQSLVSTPTEYIRIQMQTSAKGQFKGNLDVVRQIVKHNGVLGVYRAWVATAIRESIGNCFYFTFYTKTLEGLQNPDKGSAYRTSVQLLAGALGGLGCWVSTFPVDVIKSRQQADSLTSPKYNSLRFCAKDTFEQLGFKGFTNGIAICLVRACFVNALTFAAFEWGKGLCEKLE